MTYLSPRLLWPDLGCLMQVEELKADNKMDCLAGTEEGGGTTGSPPSHSPATPALESLVNPGWGLPVTDAGRVSLALSKERPRGSTELPAKPPCLGFLQKDQVREGEGLLSHPTTCTPVHTRPGGEQGIGEVDPLCPRGSLVPSGMHPQLRTSRRGGSLPRQPGPPPQPATLLSSLPTSFQVDLFLELQPPPPPSPSPPWATRSFLASLPSAVSRNHPGSKGADGSHTAGGHPAFLSPPWGLLPQTLGLLRGFAEPKQPVLPPSAALAQGGGSVSPALPNPALNYRFCSGQRIKVRFPRDGPTLLSEAPFSFPEWK